ncbi:hypothetical protein, partial [Escherichia sp. E5028]|uniref:hypothetical protein n=1 Tax=Escherichia sp. E5028 TaxID=2044602 RepID=UPI00197E929B
MNDCPRRYTQKKAGLSVSFTSSTKTRQCKLAGFLLLRGSKMNDCPRRYTQKKAAYRSVSPLQRKTRQ